MREISLDANPTVRTLGVLVNAVASCNRTVSGHPSSEHRRGVGARAVLEQARDAVAEPVDEVDQEDVVLNSGGTEGSNTFLAAAGDEATVVTTTIEHPATKVPSLRAEQRGARLALVPVDDGGRAEPAAFREIATNATSEDLSVSVQWTSGETGVIQPVSDIVDAVKSVHPDALKHGDPAQAVGRSRIGALPDGAALTVSGHKLHCPQGTDVMVLSKHWRERLPALLEGSEQERERRSGTENVAGVAGLAATLRARAGTFGESVQRMRSLRDSIGLVVP